MQTRFSFVLIMALAMILALTACGGSTQSTILPTQTPLIIVVTATSLSSPTAGIPFTPSPVDTPTLAALQSAPAQVDIPTSTPTPSPTNTPTQAPPVVSPTPLPTALPPADFTITRSFSSPSWKVTYLAYGEKVGDQLNVKIYNAIDGSQALTMTVDSTAKAEIDFAVEHLATEGKVLNQAEWLILNLNTFNAIPSDGQAYMGFLTIDNDGRLAFQSQGVWWYASEFVVAHTDIARYNWLKEILNKDPISWADVRAAALAAR